MKEDTILQRNLLALSGKNPNTARLVARADGFDRLVVKQARTGMPVPSIQTDEGHRSLHSQFDPEREGERISDASRKSGYVVVFGLGAAYHVFPLLRNQNISYILIIEKNASFVKSLLSAFDFRKLFITPKVNLFVDETPENIKRFILSNYFPAVIGNLHSVNLRSRFEFEKDYFLSVLSAIESCINELSDDYTVQTHFGKKWFLNTISNLPAAETSSTVLRPIKKAIITGAGPSLEIQLDKIYTLKRKGACLIATDTSLPSLIRFGLRPDIVVSIDCQHITYHHFLSGYPKEVPLVLDLASPRIITQLTDKLVFFTSGHPFSLYVSSHWRQFPLIDISGGNVSHGALSLALKLGAKEVYLAGVDFSYPEGKSYARGTYLYTYFQQTSTLINPLENHFFSFLLRNARISKELVRGKYRYTTKPMISYKERLEKSFSYSPAKFIVLTGKGVPISIISAQVINTNSGTPQIFSAGRSLKHWVDFLSEYLEGLNNLNVPDNIPVSVYFSDLDPEERDLWVTLLPAAATFQKDDDKLMSAGREVLRLVKTWSIDSIRQFLLSNS